MLKLVKICYSSLSKISLAQAIKI